MEDPLAGIAPGRADIRAIYERIIDSSAQVTVEHFDNPLLGATQPVLHRRQEERLFSPGG